MYDGRGSASPLLGNKGNSHMVKKMKSLAMLSSKISQMKKEHQPRLDGWNAFFVTILNNMHFEHIGFG